MSDKSKEMVKVQILGESYKIASETSAEYTVTNMKNRPIIRAAE